MRLPLLILLPLVAYGSEGLFPLYPETEVPAADVKPTPSPTPTPKTETKTEEAVKPAAQCPEVSQQQVKINTEEFASTLTRSDLNYEIRAVTRSKSLLNEWWAQDRGQLKVTSAPSVLGVEIPIRVLPSGQFGALLSAQIPVTLTDGSASVLRIEQVVTLIPRVTGVFVVSSPMVVQLKRGDAWDKALTVGAGQGRWQMNVTKDAAITGWLTNALISVRPVIEKQVMAEEWRATLKVCGEPVWVFARKT